MNSVEYNVARWELELIFESHSRRWYSDYDFQPAFVGLQEEYANSNAIGLSIVAVNHQRTICTSYGTDDFYKLEYGDEIQN